MSGFLAQSSTINYGHPAVEELFAELDTDGTESTFARNAFHYVRDSIKFEFCPFEDKLSDTVAKKKGQCYHKTNLLVGLCRRKGIPAGIKFSVLDLEVMRPVFSDEMMRMFEKEPIGHFFAAILLGDKWVSIDPIYDIALLRHMDRLDWANAQEWDGTSPAKLPQALILSERPDVWERAFPEHEIPHNPIVDLMNARLKGIREEIG